MEEAKIVRLEAWQLTEPQEGELYLRQMLHLPEHEEGCLVALHDTLVEHSGLGIVLIGSELMQQSSWGKQLLGVFMQSANENRQLHLVFRD